MISNLSRGVTLLYLVMFSACLVVSRPLVRMAVRHLAGTGAIQQRIAFYGADPESIAIIRKVIAGIDLPHLRVLGVADDRPKVKDIDGLPLIGGLDALLDLARKGELDQVLFCVPNLPKERLHDIVDQLSNVSIDVAVIPPEAIHLAPGYRVHLLGQLPVLTLWQRPFRDMNGLVKRSEDLLIAGAAVVLMAPLLLLTALLVRLSSPGPIFFVQPRIGFNNELIHVLKFRTMYADRSDLRAEQTTTADDPRVTPIGRVLRRLSLDELPQLFNVIRGDMSLVGPRPHATHMKVGDRYYQDAVRGYAGRHRVKPGITGLAQVKGVRGEIRTIERAKLRVELDTKYIENWSLWQDLWILAATFRAVIWDRDAYCAERLSRPSLRSSIQGSGSRTAVAGDVRHALLLRCDSERRPHGPVAREPGIRRLPQADVCRGRAVPVRQPHPPAPRALARRRSACGPGKRAHCRDVRCGDPGRRPDRHRRRGHRASGRLAVALPAG
jgi:Undecaprenyl-phosphate glucose phosphotransferase